MRWRDNSLPDAQEKNLCDNESKYTVATQNFDYKIFLQSQTIECSISTYPNALSGCNLRQSIVQN